MTQPHTTSSPRSVIVNGATRTTSADSIPALLVELGMDPSPRGVAIAIDGVIVPRSRWTDVAPHADAVIDIVSAVQGG